MEYLIILGYLFVIGISSKLALVEFNHYKDFSTFVSWMVISMLQTIAFVFYMIGFYKIFGLPDPARAKILLVTGWVLITTIFIIVMIMSVYIQRAFFRRKGEDRSSSSHETITTVLPKM